MEVGDEVAVDGEQRGAEQFAPVLIRRGAPDDDVDVQKLRLDLTQF